MKLASGLNLRLKAFRQLGPGPLGLYGLYQLGLRSGHYRRQLTATLARLQSLNRGSYLKLHLCIPGLPERDTLLELLGDQIEQVYLQADGIISGKVRLFGSQPGPLVLTL